MRRITITLAITLGVLTMSIAIVDACGDKLLRIGRGARFQHSIHAASILIYIPASAATTVPRLQSFLKGQVTSLEWFREWTTSAER